MIVKSKPMKSLLILFAGIILLIPACERQENTGKEIEFCLIGQGDLTGNGAENIPKGNFVISQSASWTEWLEKMNTVNRVSDQFTETDIDFSRYVLLACFDEIKTTGGYKREITRIIETEDEIEVYVKTNFPGYAAPAVMTQPFIIVKIEKTPKPIVFFEE